MPFFFFSMLLVGTWYASWPRVMFVRLRLRFLLKTSFLGLGEVQSSSIGEERLRKKTNILPTLPW